MAQHRQTSRQRRPYSAPAIVRTSEIAPDPPDLRAALANLLAVGPRGKVGAPSDRSKRLMGDPDVGVFFHSIRLNLIGRDPVFLPRVRVGKVLKIVRTDSEEWSVLTERQKFHAIRRHKIDAGDRPSLLTRIERAHGERSRLERHRLCEEIAGNLRKREPRLAVLDIEDLTAAIESRSRSRAAAGRFSYESVDSLAAALTVLVLRAEGRGRSRKTVERHAQRVRFE